MWIHHDAIDIAQRLKRAERAVEASVQIRLDLVVKDSTYLINLDDGSASIVMDYTILPIMVENALLLKFCVTRVLLGERVLVPDRDVRVDDGIGGRDSNHAARVVSLLYLIKIETSRFRLVVLITHTIILLISVEDALTVRSWVSLASSRYRLVVRNSSCLPLEPLCFFDIVTVAVSLAVHIFISFRHHRSLNERAFRKSALAA